MMGNLVLLCLALMIVAATYSVVYFAVLIVFLIKFTIQTLKELYNANSK